jgi:hypothetical protein
MNEEWQLKVKQFCDFFNIPVTYLADTLYDPKVTPMIRGKAFEYSAMIALRKSLPPDEWEVSKPILNPQLGFHDIDIKVIHKKTGKSIGVECKLAKKEGFRAYGDGHSKIEVKCMRSRTLGEAMVRELSPRLGIAPEVLAIHNDQYLPNNFDIVITTIGNAFYRTNPQTSMYEWKPNIGETAFLQALNLQRELNLKDFAFSKMYLSMSTNLVTSKVQVVCSRKKCPDVSDHGVNSLKINGLIS